MSDTSLSELLRVAVEAAKLAGDHTLRYFNRGVDVELKADQSPVTRADREAESIAREFLMKHFPSHSLLGEEHGTVKGDPEYEWVIDPIDGTKSFIHGVPLYTTLIGLQIKNRPAVGVIYAPATGELVAAATGLGCTLNGNRCRVSEVSELNQAAILTSGLVPALKRPALIDLARQCRISRTWGDGYGYLLVATGRADIMVDPKMNPWDICALIPCITEAGGICTSWKGETTIHGGDLFACNAKLAKIVQPVLQAG